MALLTKDQILGADDRKSETVEVPEWSGSVKIRSMSGAEAEEYGELATEEGKGSMTKIAFLLVGCVVDENNEPVFTEEDVEALRSKNVHVLNKIAEACLRVNGFDQEKVAEALKEMASA